ncbi:DUF1428 domain-containing protein [Myxococcus stipitatus]|uniref:DUF1428 domain-containing protein n=1 Tax=Myxococcus stipitatus TaxID=83455 RepID=UPI0030D22278
MAYVDGFLLPVPTKNVADYRKLSRKAGKVWMEYGALQYLECVADDLDDERRAMFGRSVKLKPGETVVFSWILYKSRADRNRINKKVMADPRMKVPDSMPFDSKRMVWGGFKALVQF